MSKAVFPPEAVALRAAALKAMGRAYAPYSRLAVGAAIMATSGEIFAGCNVENAAFPVGLCAEATALGAMVARLGGTRVRAALVVVEGPEKAWPCGACRQRLWEFALADTVVYATTLAGEWASSPLIQLLPLGFGPHNLRTGK